MIKRGYKGQAGSVPRMCGRLDAAPAVIGPTYVWKVGTAPRESVPRMCGRLVSLTRQSVPPRIGPTYVWKVGTRTGRHRFHVCVEGWIAVNEEDVIDRLKQEHRRAIADTVVALSDRAWTRGWIVGVATGVSVTMLILLLVKNIWR